MRVRDRSRRERCGIGALCARSESVTQADRKEISVTPPEADFTGVPPRSVIQSPAIPEQPAAVINSANRITHILSPTPVRQRRIPIPYYFAMRQMFVQTLVTALRHQRVIE